MKQFLVPQESVDLGIEQKIDDLVVDEQAREWLEQVDHKKIGDAIKDAEAEGDAPVGVTVHETKLGGRTFEALVLYSQTGEALKNLCAFDFREIVTINEAGAYSNMEGIEDEDAAGKEYWYNPVHGVPREGGRFEVPAGTILLRRESMQGETRYVLVKVPILVKLQEIGSTNYDNQRVVVSDDKRSFWMKGEFTVDPESDPDKEKTLIDLISETLGLVEPINKKKIEQLQDPDPAKRMAAVKELYDSGAIDPQKFKEYLRDTNGKKKRQK